jgi:16S rRNA (cytosine1402-N4)-methyltransferase
VNDIEHVPVLLEEVLQALNLRPDGIYVDATYGRGGHAQEMLRRLGPQARLVALDRDPQALEDAHSRFGRDKRFEIHRGPFSMLGEIVRSLGLAGRVNGILFDLGMSSPQLDDARRGFSFRLDGPLDMRMDPAAGESAAAWLNRAEEPEIAQILREYGEERFSRRIARSIVRARAEQPIATTTQLRDIVAGAVPTRERGKDPATRTFQAIRIFINRELEEIGQVLPQAVKALAPQGRLAVISFHSLEDRLVKRFLRHEVQGEELPPGLPVFPSHFQSRLRLIGKAIKPGETEVRRNPRARSAVLRVAERTEVAYA